jgi:hypothetical protein
MHLTILTHMINDRSARRRLGKTPERHLNKIAVWSHNGLGNRCSGSASTNSRLLSKVVAIGFNNSDETSGRSESLLQPFKKMLRIQ